MPTSGNTGYREIKHIAIQRMQNGTWAPGDILPSEAKLALEFSCTRTTVSRAMQELANEGYLERKRKAGTKVLINPSRQARLSIPLIKDEIQSTGAAYRYSLVTRERCPVPDWLSSRLSLPGRGDALHLLCMHYSDNRPFALEDRWINLAAVPDAAGEDFSQMGPNEWLVRKIPYSRAQFSFVATIADQRLAQFLATRPGEAILQADRITWLRETAVTFALLSFTPGYRIRTEA